MHGKTVSNGDINKNEKFQVNGNSLTSFFNRKEMLIHYFNHYLFSNVFNLFTSKAIKREGGLQLYFFISIFLLTELIFFVWIHILHIHLHSILAMCIWVCTCRYMRFLIQNFVFEPKFFVFIKKNFVNLFEGSAPSFKKSWMHL